jgi:large subunit ribosomal protein L15
MRDIIKRLPKLRGHGKNRARTVNETRVRPAIINLGVLQAAFPEGGEITPALLAKRGLVAAKYGKTPVVKLLGAGEFTKKFTVVGCMVSASAKVKIEKAGGTVAPQ